MDNDFIYDEDATALMDFLQDIACLEPIEARADKFNLFDVFGFAKNEIRHSFFLKWLLDPKNNHQLGDSFIRALISSLVSSDPNRYGQQAFSLILLDCTDFTVMRETNDIDLLLLSEKNSIAIVIENKIGSHEHASTGFDSQLTKYHSFIEKAYPQIKTKIYVYLSPKGELPRDKKNKKDWQILSYLSIVEIVEKLLEDNKERLSSEVEMLIQNYIDVLRRDVVEDSELKKYCNEIYKKHRKALDLIYMHTEMGKDHTVQALKDALNELDSKGLIAYDPKVRDTFYTPRMTSYLPDLNSTKSAWNNNHVYRYWFEFENGMIKYVFDISFKGSDDSNKAKLEGLYKTRNPKRTMNKTYNRIESSEKVNISEYDDDELKEKIIEMVHELLENEIIWIDKCESYLSERNNG